MCAFKTFVRQKLNCITCLSKKIKNKRLAQIIRAIFDR